MIHTTQPDAQTTVGMTLGAIAGVIKGLFLDYTFLGIITPSDLVTTAILATVGAICGFVVTESLKYIKIRFDERIQRKRNKKLGN